MAIEALRNLSQSIGCLQIASRKTPKTENAKKQRSQTVKDDIATTHSNKVTRRMMEMRNRRKTKVNGALLANNITWEKNCRFLEHRS